MSTTRSPTCPVCGQEVGSNDHRLYKQKPYHFACYDKMIAAARAKDTAGAYSSSAYDPGASALASFILNKFGLKEISALIRKQVNTYLSQGINFTEQLQALKFFYEVKENKLPDRPTVGIIPYVIEESRTYYADVQKANESNRGKVITQKESVVRVDPSRWEDKEKYDINDL